ncbi:MAG TPA: tyrosine-protein phosphatase [Jatrophihabitans sp.]|nr:tyrosine-protein phosphatase [Jatrophihabitans sp.]
MGRRWVPGSAVNFRDIGCQPTIDGGRTRPGVLFRSESPQFLQPADARRLVDEIGLRLVVDLRFADEAANEGRGPLGEAPVTYLNVPIIGAGGADVGVALLDDTDDTLAPYYVSYVKHSADALLSVYRSLAAPDGLPALVHCAAGKDRTGVVVALLLSAMGVTDDAIVADYARTGDAMPQVLRRLGTAPSYATQIAGQAADDVRAMAHPQSMRAFLSWVRREHGSGGGLLRDLGLEAEALDRLRHRLIDRAAA